MIFYFIFIGKVYLNRPQRRALAHAIDKYRSDKRPTLEEEIIEYTNPDVPLQNRLATLKQRIDTLQGLANKIQSDIEDKNKEREAEKNNEAPEA